MKRYSAYVKRFPALYNHLVMDEVRLNKGWSISEVARRSKQPFENVRNAFLGKAKNQTVYPVCEVLGIDWLQIHNLDLKRSEFHLAAANGNGSKDGSTKAR